MAGDWLCVRLDRRELRLCYECRYRRLDPVTSGPHEALQPAWSPDGRRIAFVWNEDGNVSVGIRDLAARATRYVRVAPGVHQWPQFTRDGRHLAFLYEGPRSPCDLWVLSLSGGRKRQLTRSLPLEFTGQDFVAPEVVRWQCDGLTISGLLYRPLRKRGQLRRPLRPRWSTRGIRTNARASAASSARLCCARAQLSRQRRLRQRFQKANRFDLGGVICAT
jgi:dipeptidyl aminopeptidase/acylaminoacyl peptidase